MADSQQSSTVAQLLSQFRNGDASAAGHLIEVLHPELRRIAGARMKGERIQHTWQPTVLVNELYLALVKTKGLGDGADAEEEKSAFLRLCGHIMRHLLIDHARPLYRRATKVQLQDLPKQDWLDTESLQFVEEALSRLPAIDPKLRTVIELKVFEGMTGDEIAQRLNCSSRSVASYWAVAKKWLAKELGDRRSSAASAG
jgi:RNA polymerase sigma factor (TIGR02999 family)